MKENEENNLCNTLPPVRKLSSIDKLLNEAAMVGDWVEYDRLVTVKTLYEELIKESNSA